MVQRQRVLVIGAGMAGLTAARRLAATHEVVVLDKGRGVGGRMATRRIGDATFDHGAQFVTTHTEAFAAEVAGWARDAVAERWFTGRIGPDGLEATDGHARYRGSVSMNAVAKHLAAGLDVRLGDRVVGLSLTGPMGWTATTDGGASYDADAVLMTMPVPQALELLAAVDGEIALSPDDRHALAAIRYEPCLAALVPLDGPSGIAPPGAVDPASGPIDWMADNRLKGISLAEGVTIHASAEYSEARWDDDVPRIVEDLLACVDLRSSPIDVLAQVQRWRYARPAVLHPERHLVASGLPPLVFAGDAFGGAKVEGAALSGMSAADAIATSLVR